MITIDLRPDIQSKPNYRLLIQVGIVLILGCGLSYSLPIVYEKKIIGQAQIIEAENSRKKQEIVRLKEELKTVEILKAKLAEINQRTRDIKILGEGRKEPVVLLDQLQRQHLERMWIEAIKLEEKKVQLLGWAVDHGVVAEYARRLRQVNQELELERIDLDTFDPRLALMPHAFMQAEDPDAEEEENKEKADESSELNTEILEDEGEDTTLAATESDLPPEKQKEKKKLEHLSSSHDENLENLSRIYGLKFDRVHIVSANEENIQNVPMQKFEISFALERFAEEK
jgi:Tfp pilus assembly protein PilN